MLTLNNGAAVDSYLFNNSNLNGYNWVDLGSVDEITTITIDPRNNNDAAYIGAVEVNGQILKDLNTSFNETRIWSSGAGYTNGTGDSRDKFEDAFDGSNATFTCSMTNRFR